MVLSQRLRSHLVARRKAVTAEMASTPISTENAGVHQLESLSSSLQPSTLAENLGPGLFTLGSLGGLLCYLGIADIR